MRIEKEQQTLPNPNFESRKGKIAQINWSNAGGGSTRCPDEPMLKLIGIRGCEERCDGLDKMSLTAKIYKMDEKFANYGMYKTRITTPQHVVGAVKRRITRYHARKVEILKEKRREGFGPEYILWRR